MVASRTLLMAEMDFPEKIQPLWKKNPKSIKKSTDEILGATKVAEAFKENEIQI